MNLRDKIYGMIFKLMQEEVVALWNECVHEGMGTDCLYVYSMDDFDEILLNKDISPVEIMWQFIVETYRLITNGFVFIGTRA